MNKRRLLKMADFVETIPRKEFDMRDVWRETPCGSVGCALGHAAHARVFRYLRLSRNVLTFRGELEPFEYAAKALFGIPLHDARMLFLPAVGHETREDVAANIRRYVATGELP